MKPMFRSAMFGFRKEDVADFIAKQNHQYEIRIEELKSQLDSEIRRFEDEKNDFVLDRDELEALREKENTGKKQILLATDMIKNLEEKTGCLSEVGAECKEAFAGLQSNVAVLNRKLSDAEQYREKAARFDRLATVLGEIVSGTENTAKFSESEPREYAPEISVDTDAILKKQEAALAELMKICAELLALVSEAETAE